VLGFAEPRRHSGFTRQAAVCAELHKFGVCADLLEEA